MPEPRPGKVYVMAGDDGTVKVGRSERPDQRVKEVAFMAGRVVSLVYSTLGHDDAVVLERTAQAHLAHKRLRGDWFRASAEEAILAVTAAVEGRAAPERPEQTFTKFDMRADDEFLRKVDELRRGEPDIPSRAQMVRRVVGAMFEQMEQRKRRASPKRGSEG